jgi:membrane protease YdiL (CAAX protease family)
MISFSFIFLTLAIIFVWPAHARKSLLSQYSWLVLLFISLLFGLGDGTLEPVTLLPIIAFTALVIPFHQTSGVVRFIFIIAILALTLALGLHIAPGFHNPIVISDVQLANDSLPYTLQLNYDKALAGLFLLWLSRPLLQNSENILLMIKQSVPIALLTICLVIALSVLLDYIRLDIKLPSFIFYWLWANLFFTCVAEEALFRGFLQQQITLGLRNYRHGALAALISCAVLFGLAHAGGGMIYVILATVAGLGYGAMYLRTGRIEASILLHFMLNTVHILFFSYPALENS